MFEEKKKTNNHQTNKTNETPTNQPPTAKIKAEIGTWN